MNIQNFIERAHRTATEHGFHDKRESNEHWLLLVITEICEAVEAHRKGEFTGDQHAFMEREHVHPDFNERYEAYMKGSMAEELADVCIRIFDFMGEIGIMEGDVNSVIELGDGYKDIGNDKSFPEQAFSVIETITNCWNIPIVCYVVLRACMMWARKYKIDLEWNIRLKMQYNENRPKMHGKAY